MDQYHPAPLVGPCLKGAEPCAKITWRTLRRQAPCISCRDSHRSPQTVQVAHGSRACPVRLQESWRSSVQRRSVLDQLWRRIRPVVRLDQLALARDLSTPLADLPLASGVTVRTAAPEDLPRLAAAMRQVFRRPLLEEFRRPLLEEFEERHERGHVCGIAEKDGEIRLMVWVRFDEASQLQMGAHVRLRPGEVYAYALFAPPEYRGRGLATTVGDFVLRWLGERGVRRVYAWANSSNVASLKTVGRFGFRRVGRVRQVRWRLGLRAALLNHVVYNPTDPLGEWCSPRRLRFAGGLSVFRRGQVL